MPSTLTHFSFAALTSNALVSAGVRLPINMSADHELKKAKDATISMLANFSIPLYLDKDDKPTHFGTGFFVQNRDDVFLVSAAHVLDKALSNGLYFYITPTDIRHLSGSLVRSKISTNRNDDHIDIGVVKLTGDNLPPYPNVQKYSMDISNLMPNYLPRSDKHYSFTGFPATKTKISNIHRSIEVKTYSYRSDSIPEKEYSAHNVDPSTHVVLPMNLRKGIDSNGNLIHFPKPQGMSGAPVVVLYESDGHTYRTFPVVAVAIEYRQAQKVVIATDVKYVLEAIDNATEQIVKA